MPFFKVKPCTKCASLSEVNPSSLAALSARAKVVVRKSPTDSPDSADDRKMRLPEGSREVPGVGPIARRDAVAVTKPRAEAQQIWEDLLILSTHY